MHIEKNVPSWNGSILHFDKWDKGMNRIVGILEEANGFPERINDQGKQDLALESNFHTEKLHKLICNDVGISLRGAALQFYQRNVDTYLATAYVADVNTGAITASALVKCREELKKKFVEEQQEKNLHLWNSLRQKNQSLDEFGTMVASLGGLLKLIDPLIILKFKEGIADDQVRLKMLPHKCDTLERAIEKAKQYEFGEKLVRKNEPQLNQIEQSTYRSSNKYKHGKTKQRSEKKFEKKEIRKKESDKPKFCWICGDQQHISRNCPKKKTEPTVGVVQKVNEENGKNPIEERKLARIYINIEGRNVPAMLDSGAQLELIRKDVADQLGIKFNKTTTHGTNFNGGRITLIGEKEMMVSIGNVKRSLKFHIVESMKFPVIIGILAMRRFEVTWEFSSNIINIPGGHPIKTEQFIEEDMIYSINEITLVNEFPDFFKELDFSKKIEPAKVKPHEVSVTKMERIIDPRVPRFPKRMEEQLEEMGNQFKRAGWIVEAQELGNALNLVPVVKNGKLRVTTNVAPVNEFIEDFPYSLCPLEELFAAAEGFFLVSIFDLEKGYFQVPLHPNSRKFFHTRWPGHGIVAWTVMVQGDKTAPGKFQLEMDIMLRRLNNSRNLSSNAAIIARLDDIAVFTKIKSPEAHLNDVRVLIKEFIKSGWRGNQTKIKLFRTTAEWLGQVISREGISPQMHKIHKLHDLEFHLQTPTQIRRFLGAVNEYRKFIDNLASLAEPFYEALRKNGEIKPEELKVAAKEIIARLEDAKPLKIPDTNNSFVLETDASELAYGAVLKQNDRPIMFISNTFNPTQRNYSTGDKEMLGIVLAIKKLKYYLFGNQVTVFTDHQPNINFLFRNPSDMSNRQKRWLEFLNQFNLKILWTQGKNLSMADALSRSVEYSINFFGQNICWRTEQMKDTQLKPIIEALSSGCKINDKLPDWWKNCYLSKDDTLMMKDEDKNFKKMNRFKEMIIVPEHLRTSLIWEAHREFPYGHYGIRATTNCLQQSYYWPNIKKDVSEIIRTCEPCQKTKPLNFRAGLIIPVQWNVTRPFQLVGMDFAGPLPKSTTGNKYFLIIIDYATSWIEGYALPKQNSSSMIKSVANWIHRYGIMENIITDGGSPFTSTEALEFFKENGIAKHTTSSYHPKSDGKAEANIKIIKNIIKKNIIYNIIEEKQWDDFLQTACFAIRTSTKTATNMSPAEMLFGFKLRTHINLHQTIPEVEELYEIRTKIYEAVQRHMKKYIKRYSEHYNKNRIDVDLKVGDYVLVRKPHILKALESKFQGPYKISAKYNNAYELINDDGKKPFKSTVNIERLKKFFPEQSTRKKQQQQLMKEIDIYSEWPYDLTQTMPGGNNDIVKEIPSTEIQIVPQPIQDPEKQRAIVPDPPKEIVTQGGEKIMEEWVRPREIKNRKQLIKILENKNMKTKGTFSDLQVTYENAYNKWYERKRKI